MSLPNTVAVAACSLRQLRPRRRTSRHLEHGRDRRSRRTGCACVFRTVLLASTAVPGAFPPVWYYVEANGKRSAELHVDGGIGGPFFVAPGPLLLPTSDFRLPATQLYVVINTGLERDFQSSTFSDDLYPGSRRRGKDRYAIDARHRLLRHQTQCPSVFNVAAIRPSFNAPSKGPFDLGVMGPLFQAGYDARPKRDTIQATNPRLYPSAPPPAVECGVSKSGDELMTHALRRILVVTVSLLGDRERSDKSRGARRREDFDGMWSVLFQPLRGDCGAAPTFSFCESSMRPGVFARIQVTRPTAWLVTARSGVVVSQGDQSASGFGRLRRGTGRGQWRPAKGECSGQWAAEPLSK